MITASRNSFDQTAPPTLHGVSLGVTSCKPLWAAQPWPYQFSKGEHAWARGVNNIWRSVIIEDEGLMEIHDGRLVIVYTARWRRDGTIVRGAFAPLDGDLKPDTPEIRRLLQEDEARVML